MRFGIFGLLAALGIGMITVTGDVSTADAQVCRKNYYRCDLNRGGRIDPANPNCCWSPAAGPPSTSCPRKFYKCDLNVARPLPRVGDLLIADGSERRSTKRIPTESGHPAFRH